MQGISYFCRYTLHMVQYTSQHQLKIEEFGNLYQMKLNPDNRWVRLAHHFPWDRCARAMHATSPAPAGARYPRVS